MKDRFTRLAPPIASDIDTASRTVSYVFSDESVGRDGHIVKASAWRTDNFEKNPVFLFAHDDSSPPIGRVFDLHTVNRELRGSVKYAQTEFADTIYQLVRDGMLSAVSTSWQPIEYDRMTSGGCIFTDVDLLEISQVPIPALPSALATARSRGINVRPLRQWAERALDTRSYRAVPRDQLEAIHRACNSASTSSGARRRRDDPERAARRARLNQLDEIARKGDRMERARRLAAGEVAHYRGADRAKLKDARRILKRATKHHEAVSLRHGDTRGHLDDLKKIHQRMTSTLSELGERSAHSKMSRHLEALDRCGRAMREDHTDQADGLDNLGTAISDASECVDQVIDDDNEPTAAAVG